MGKNIILTEEQFKQYIKGMLVNEGSMGDIGKKKMPMTPTELGKKIKEWYDNDDIKYTLKEVFLDKVVPNGVDVNTPMTFAEAASSLGFADLYKALKVLSSRAKGNLVGPKGGKIAQRMIKQGKGFLLKDRDETSAEHKIRGVVGKEAKQEIAAKEGFKEQDKLFKDTLNDLITNGDPEGKLPHSQLTPEDMNEPDYLELKQTCYDNLIQFTNNGEIYLPVKMNMTMVNKLVKDINSPFCGYKPSVAIQKVPSQHLPKFLVQAGEMGKFRYLEKYINKGILTPPLCWFR